MAGRLAALPGVRLWYIDSGGDGVPVVLLHANTGTVAAWEPQIGPFAAAGYRVIAFDRRGWGKSLADPETGPQPGSVSADLDALLIGLALPPCHLVGIAGGGFEALDYASWRPERVRSLVVAASTGAIVDAEIADFAARIRIPPIADPAPPHWREVGPSFRGGEPERTRLWLEIAEHARQPGAVAQPRRTPNTYAKIASIRAPSLVVAAGADLLAPPGLMRLWAAHLPRHEWALLPDAGHAVAWERPYEFNRLCLEFWGRN